MTGKQETFAKIASYEFGDITDKVLQYFGTGGRIKSEDLKKEVFRNYRDWESATIRMG